jgi:hypothetical protein
MDIYVKNLLPRLRELGKTLNAKESFVDKTWTLIDQSGSSNVYRFLRSGKLLVSKSGLVNEFTWEYLPPDSLYLKMGSKGVMLKHGYVFDAILVMQIEGAANNLMFFYNEKEIPDGNLSRYVRQKLTDQYGYKKLGEKYFIKDQYNLGLTIGTQVLNNDLELINAKGLKFGDKYYTLQNGVVTKCEIKKRFKTNKGIIFIRVDAESGGMLNAPVNKETGFLGDGVYLIEDNEIKKITIKAGIVIHVSYNWHKSPILVIALIVLALLVLIFINKNQTNSGPENVTIPTQNLNSLESEPIAFVDSDPMDKPEVDIAVIDKAELTDKNLEDENYIVT